MHYPTRFVSSAWKSGLGLKLSLKRSSITSYVVFLPGAISAEFQV